MSAVNENKQFVKVMDYIPDILVDLPYATDHNFVGCAFYQFSDAWLRLGTVKKLERAQAALRKLGLGLKIWDAFRPVSAQYLLWEVLPDPRYVADPHRGFSNHSRGNCVDVTLVDRQGQPVKMPSGFDCFQEAALCQDGEALAHAELLKKTMVRAGFRPLEEEWWHFVDRDGYEVEKEFIPIQKEENS